MTPKIRCGGYKTPFDPFLRADGTRVCDPETTDLALWANKLGPKQQDKWLAAASWRNEAGKLCGAQAWKANGRGDVYWDDQPLSYDPRPAGDRESWGEHRPRYSGNGWWTGAVFPDARDVEISNPADVSATTYQLAPGVTIVPQLAVPYYGSFYGAIGYGYAFNSDGSFQQYNSRYTYPNSPIAGYSALAAAAFGPRGDGQIYKFNTSYYNINAAGRTLYPIILSGTEFGYSVFYPNKTPAQIPTTHEVAAPLTRAPQPGDIVATYLGRTITYQESRTDSYGYVDEFEQDQVATTAPIPAGTLVVYRWAQTAVEKIAPITTRNNAVDGTGLAISTHGITDDGINSRYGVSVSGVRGANEVNRTGKCYIFEWWRDQYVLHEGTYSIKQKSRVEDSEDRPVNSSGPATSGAFPGWPSKRKECEDYRSTLRSFSINISSGSHLKEFTTNVTLTWSGFGGTGGSQDIAYKTVEWTSTNYSEGGLYDPAKGAPPSARFVWQPVPASYHVYYPYKSPEVMYEPYDVTAVGAVERRSNGDRIGGCFQEGVPNVNPSTGGLVSFGPNTGGVLFSDGSPATCTIYGAYFHGGLVSGGTLNTPFVVREGAPNEGSGPDCALTDGRKGSSIPGFPLDNAAVPELPGGLGNQSSSKSVSEVEIEYEIQAPIARGMTARSYYYESTRESTGGTAQWNGNIASSTYTPEETTETTLEFIDPVTMIRDDLAGYEEVLYVSLEFDRKTGSFSPSSPPPPDRVRVFYRKAGGTAVEVNEAIKDEFPEAAWAKPRDWNWTQWMGLKAGVLYLYKNDAETLGAYKSKSGKVKADRYLVSDGSFSLQGSKSFEALSLNSKNAVIFDHHAFG